MSVHAGIARGCGGVLAAIAWTLVVVTPAAAWKPSTHVYLAEEALRDALDDGKVTFFATNYLGGTLQRDANGHPVPIGSYAVDATLLTAIRNNRAQFRAGVLGPDAYPDILTGQQIIHPAGANTPGEPANVDINVGGPGTDPWLTHLWGLAFGPGPASNHTPQIQAFVAGYLSHAAGDIYAHTMVNAFTGAPFHPLENAIKHLVLEGYVGKRTPDLESWDVSISGVDAFIYQNMVNATPGSPLEQHLLRGDAASTSVPSVFSKLRIRLQQDIDAYYKTKGDFQKSIDAKLTAAAKCQPADFTCSRTALTAEAGILQGQLVAFVAANGLIVTYKEHWRDDIDAGLKAWPATSHEMAKALVFNPNGIDKDRAKQVAEDYLHAHLLSMSGAPDIVGITLQMEDQILTALGIPQIQDAIHQMKPNLLDYILKHSFGVTVDDLETYAKNPELEFNPVLNSSTFNHEGNGTLVSMAAFNADQLHITDSGYSHPEQRYKVEEVPAAYNTMTMIKLLLLSPASVNSLLHDLHSSATFSGSNVMLGFIQTLDGSNQWLANDSKMILAADCGAYRQIFMKQPGETICPLRLSLQTRILPGR